MDRPREMCSECGGSGATYDGDADCGVCNGFGWIYAQVPHRPSVEDCVRTVLGEYVPSGWQGEVRAIREETVRLIRAGAEADRLREQLKAADGFCAKRDDALHCDHWWDGDRPCCACGRGATLALKADVG